MIGFQTKRIPDPALHSAPETTIRAKPTRSAFSTVTHAFPDFQSRLRMSGRWMLAVISALTIAFVDGAALAWMWHAWSGDRPFQDLLSFVSFRQTLTFWTLGLTAVLWLDSRGHYRQRLPYWETIGHVLGVALMGFVACGFVEFASRNTSSRLWTTFSWVLFAALALAGRNVVRQRLEKSGAWQVPALIRGHHGRCRAARPVAR